jgi:hypothetical protein
MFDFMKAARDQFTMILVDDRMYLGAGKLRDGIVRLPNGLNKNISLPEMVRRFGLEHKFFTRNKRDPSPVDITMDHYVANPRKYQLFILLDSIVESNTIATMMERTWPQYIESEAPPVDSKPARIAREVSLLVDVDPLDIETVQLEDDGTEEKSQIPVSVRPVFNTPKMLYLNGEPCPVITLDDHEHFTDGGRIIRFEFRGARTTEKMLISAVDAAEAFSLGKRFVNDMLMRDSYTQGEHYVILEDTPPDDNAESEPFRILRNGSNGTSSDDSVESEHGIKSLPCSSSSKNQRTYFTWLGFMRVVITATRNDNAFRTKMAHWVVNTMFVHQFGTADERQVLANELTLFRSCLNNLSGVYLIRIAKVKDLRKSMGISYDQYPAEYDNVYMYKYGRSKDILKRYKQHVKGYVRYSELLQLKSFVILPAGKEIDAETSLKDYFNDRNFHFEFTSADGHRYDELVILKNDELVDVVDIYRKLIAKYPSSDNELAMLMENIRLEATRKYEQAQSKIVELTAVHGQAMAEAAIENQRLESELRLRDERESRILGEAQAELRLRDERESRVRAEAEIKLVKAEAKNELLSLQLEISNMKLANAGRGSN